MSIDLSFHAGFEDLLKSWIEGRGEPLIYMPRFYADNNKFGLCPRCTDIGEKLITDSYCPVCFDTGFQGGYDAPVTGTNSPYQKVYAVRNQNTVITSLQAEGVVTTEQEQKISLCMDIRPRYGDLLIDKFQNRYIIGNEILDWSFNNHHIGYHASVNIQNRDNVCYIVPVPTINQVVKPDSFSKLQLRVERIHQLMLEIVK